MYLISQVSRITGLTKKALRYYDEQGILRPSLRDEENQYRLYDEKDLEKAKLINLLRELDFSISEIKDTLEVADNAEDLSYVLKEKIEFIKEHISKEKALIKQINSYLEPCVNETGKPEYEITIEEFAPQLVASLRVKDAYQNVGIHVSKIFKAVKGEACDNWLSCYFDEEYVEVADMEICVPVRKTVIASDIVCKTLPAVKAVCTTHIGSYKTIHNAYQALFSYVNEKGLNLIRPSREVYIKGPGMIFKGNPDKYRTKVILPFTSSPRSGNGE